MSPRDGTHWGKVRPRSCEQVSPSGEGEKRRVRVGQTAGAGRVNVPPLCSSPSPNVSTSARRVLVVDDFADAADSLAEVLALCGYHARAAYDTGSALAAVESCPPDVVFVEPEMSGGWELAARLLGKSGTPAIVALTTNRANSARCAAAGFAAHILKGCPPFQVAEVLENLLAATAAP
jgi:CheY-like chemotaxis protein